MKTTSRSDCAQTKVCTKCARELELDQFYRRPAGQDGYRTSCKECFRKQVTEHRWSSPEVLERSREYQRQFGKKPHRVAAVVERNRQTRERYPKVFRARELLHAAIRSGEIERPEACECGETERRLHAHHDDYNEPLKVRFLCSPCHAQWHRDNGPGRNKE